MVVVVRFSTMLRSGVTGVIGVGDVGAAAGRAEGRLDGDEGNV